MEASPGIRSAPTAPTRLYRNTSDKVIGGVCSGLAAYFRLDPALVRLAFVVFAIAGGASLLLYIVLWIAVPQAPAGTAMAVARPVNNETAAVFLIGVGLVWLLANLGVFRFVNWSFVWPLALVALGAALLFRRS